MPPTRGLLLPVGKKPEWYLTAESACIIKEKKWRTLSEGAERELAGCLEFKTCFKS